MGYEELRERAWLANRALASAGLVVLTFGNASALDAGAGLLAIKPSGVPSDRLTPDDIVVLALEDGRVVAGQPRRPSSDTPTHRVLYRAFPGVGGVVHTHSPEATAWAQAGRAIPNLGTSHADHFRGDVPVTRQMTAREIAGDYEAATGDVIVERFRRGGLDPLEIPAVLVASHGPFTWGPDPESAVENAIALEHVAGIARRTLLISPGARRVGRALRERHHTRKHGPSAYYGQVGIDDVGAEDPGA